MPLKCINSGGLLARTGVQEREASKVKTHPIPLVNLQVAWSHELTILSCFAAKTAPAFHLTERA